MIESLIQKEKIDVGAFIETGVYNTKKPYLPLAFNKMINNNIIQ